MYPIDCLVVWLIKWLAKKHIKEAYWKGYDKGTGVGYTLGWSAGQVEATNHFWASQPRYIPETKIGEHTLPPSDKLGKKVLEDIGDAMKQGGL